MEQNQIAASLRALAAQVEAGIGGPIEVRGPAETGNPALIPWGPDGTALANWWVKGYLGVMKGAHNAHYAEAHVIMGLQASDVPRHMSIVQAIPADLPWSQALVSAADCGWIDGSGYNPSPVTGAFQRWCDAGCPSKNGNAIFDVRGQPIPSSAWTNVYYTMAAPRSRQGASV